MEQSLTMSFSSQFLNFDILAGAWPILLIGAQSTLLFSLVGIPLAMAAGLLLALLSFSRFRVLFGFQRAWVDLFRALPPLVLAVLLYAGLPFAGIELTPFAAVTLTFIFNLGAYFCEIFRAGLISVPRGQSEAARSTGMSGIQTLIYVLLPQATRNVLPELVSNMIEGVKLSTIGAVVAMPELLFQAKQAQNLTFNATPIFAAAIMYFIALWPFVRLLSKLENTVSSEGTRKPVSAAH
jgi:polar amino acid transport system permease protein